MLTIFVAKCQVDFLSDEEDSTQRSVMKCDNASLKARGTNAPDVPHCCLYMFLSISISIFVSIKSIGRKKGPWQGQFEVKYFLKKKKKEVKMRNDEGTSTEIRKFMNRIF